MLSRIVWGEAGGAEATGCWDCACWRCCCCRLIADTRSAPGFGCWCCCCCRISATDACCCCCCCCKCLNDDDVNAMKLFGKPAVPRFATEAARTAEFGITAAEDLTTLGGDVMAGWVHAVEIEDEWLGRETAVVITELGRWVKACSLGVGSLSFSCGDGVLFKRDVDCCFEVAGCWEGNCFNASLWLSSEPTSAKSKIVTAGLDLRLSKTGIDLTEILCTVASFFARFNPVIIGTAWRTISGLLTAVVSILVTTAGVTTGFLFTAATVCETAAVTGLTSKGSCLHWARFISADIAGVSVHEEIVGTETPVLTVGLMEVDNLLSESLTSVLPTF